MNSKNIITIILIAVIVFFMISSSVMLIRPTSLDDLSFLKFTSHAIFDRDIVQQSKQEIESQKNNLSSESHIKYGLRLDAVYYYPILSSIIRVADILPSISPYQSVILSLIFVQLFSFSLLLFILKKNYLFILPILGALVMSLSPWHKLVPGYIIPFNYSNFFWFNGTAKNSVLVILLAFLLIFYMKSEMEPKKFWIWFSLLWLFMLLLNYPFSLMLFALWGIGQILDKHIVRKFFKTRYLSAFFASLVLLFGGIKFFVYLYQSPSLTWDNSFSALKFTPFFWFFEILILIFIWRKISNNSTDYSEKMKKFGNFILPQLIFFGSLSIGFSLLPDYPDLHYTQSKWLTAFFEFTRRNSGISHLFFWLFMGIIFIGSYQKYSVSRYVILFLAIFSLFYQTDLILKSYKANKKYYFDKLIFPNSQEIYKNENLLYQYKIDNLK